MKVGAHPMVVAVALGFLGPSALAEDEDDVMDGLDLLDLPDGANEPAASCATDGVVMRGADVADPLDVAAVRDAWTSLIR